ncbi:MAG TPA: hypothetical protein VK188_02275 [Holophaga sp.]|nr:hypothetical protein [Holophaga sp.]
MRRLLAAALLLAAAGCERQAVKAPPPPYGPWEAGKTLIYRNPADQTGDRLQVRVARTDETPSGRMVTQTYTTLKGQSAALFRQKNGGIWLVLDPQTEARLLPEGFPDRVTTWTDRHMINTVVGRARPDLPGVTLPDPDMVGVWIESVHDSGEGPRRRILFVPGLGEVQALTWTDGKWVTTNILVSHGFTDDREGAK